MFQKLEKRPFNFQFQVIDQMINSYLHFLLKKNLRFQIGFKSFKNNNINTKVPTNHWNQATKQKLFKSKIVGFRD